MALLLPKSPATRAQALITALLATSASPVLAADPERPSGADQDQFGAVIIVLAPSRLADARRRSDTATEVIEGDDLRASGAHTLQEGLQRLAGVNLNDEQGNPFQQDLSLRGLTASPVAGLAQGLSVFLDGVRINEPAVEEVNFDLVPLEDVERVEIVRGLHAIFGRNT